MFKSATEWFLKVTKKDRFTFLDYFIHFAVAINLVVALVITWYVVTG